MLTVYTVHHLRAARRRVILGTSDDPVDPELRPEFKRQTRDLVRVVDGLVRSSGTSAAAYTSSIRRQKETCETLFAGTSIPIMVDERLRQIDNGPQYTGMSFELGKQDYLEYIDTPFPQGESFRDFAGRVRDFLDELAEQHREHTVLTVGWRLSPAILAHVCRGMSLEAAIVDNENISGPFTYG
ncbi:histidine phosphatase family protein [Cellulomonas sp. URHB0016]